MLPCVTSVCASNIAGSITHVVGGSLKHPDQVRNELTSDNGIIVHKTDVIKKLGGVRNAITTEHRTPNTTFLDFAARQRMDMRMGTGINNVIRRMLLVR